MVTYSGLFEFIMLFMAFANLGVQVISLLFQFYQGIKKK
jgi:hypothetical protein